MYDGIAPRSRKSERFFRPPLRSRSASIPRPPPAPDCRRRRCERHRWKRRSIPGHPRTPRRSLRTPPPSPSASVLDSVRAGPVAATVPAGGNYQFTGILERRYHRGELGPFLPPMTATSVASIRTPDCTPRRSLFLRADKVCVTATSGTLTASATAQIVCRTHRLPPVAHFVAFGNDRPRLPRRRGQLPSPTAKSAKLPAAIRCERIPRRSLPAEWHSPAPSGWAQRPRQSCNQRRSGRRHRTHGPSCLPAIDHASVTRLRSPNVTGSAKWIGEI